MGSAHRHARRSRPLHRQGHGCNLYAEPQRNARFQGGRRLSRRRRTPVHRLRRAEREPVPGAGRVQRRPDQRRSAAHLHRRQAQGRDRRVLLRRHGARRLRRLARREQSHGTDQGKRHYGEHRRLCRRDVEPDRPAESERRRALESGRQGSDGVRRAVPRPAGPESDVVRPEQCPGGLHLAGRAEQLHERSQLLRCAAALRLRLPRDRRRARLRDLQQGLQERRLRHARQRDGESRPRAMATIPKSPTTTRSA